MSRAFVKEQDDQEGLEELPERPISPNPNFVTQRGLTVVDVIPDDNLLLVRGSVPGPKGAVVEIRSAS